MKLIAAGLLAASVSAPAMAVTFQFDPANTKVEITNDPFCLGNCNLSFTADYTLAPFDVSLDTPTTVDFGRSEEHTSELQSLMRISYAVFCLKKKNNKKYNHYTTTHTTKLHIFA